MVDDKFSVLSSVSVTFVLIEATETSNVVKAGTEVGTAQIYGTIGEGFDIQAK